MHITAVFSDKAESLVQLLIEEDSGIASKKNIRLSEFKSILELSYEAKSNMLPIGKLPKGYYDGFLSAGDELSYSMAVFAKSDMRYINYYDELFYVPFPALMFKFEVKKGNVTVSEVFAMDTDQPSETSKLYHYPYGNVYRNGAICWGSNALGPVLYKKDLDNLITCFFCSGTNDDLFKSDRYQTQREFLMYMKGRKVFPKDLLAENPTYTCVGKMLN